MSGLFGDEFQKGDGPPVSKRCTAAPCGTGPEGETCGSCAYLTRANGGASYYLKCGKVKHLWTHGSGSDIRAKWAACREWEARGIK